MFFFLTIVFDHFMLPIGITFFIRIITAFYRTSKYLVTRLLMIRKLVRSWEILRTDWTIRQFLPAMVLLFVVDWGKMSFIIFNGLFFPTYFTLSLFALEINRKPCLYELITMCWIICNKYLSFTLSRLLASFRFLFVHVIVITARSLRIQIVMQWHLIFKLK